MLPDKEQVLKPEKGLVVEPIQEQVVEPNKKHVVEFMKEQVLEPEKGLVVEPIQQQVVEPKKKPALENVDCSFNINGYDGDDKIIETRLRKLLENMKWMLEKDKDLPHTMMSIFFKAIGVQNDDKDEVYIENMKNIMSELKFDVTLTDEEIIDKIKKKYERRLKSGEIMDNTITKMYLISRPPKITLIARPPIAFNNRYRLNILSKHIWEQLQKHKDIIRETLMNDLVIHKGLKVNTLLNLEFKQDRDDGKAPDILEGDNYISTETVIITSEGAVKIFVESKRITEKIDSYNFENSDISIKRIKEHIINMFKYKPIDCSSYIELAKANKNSTKN